MTINLNNLKIAVVGLGYVGLPLALLMKSKRLDVLGYDLDKNKVSLINNGISPFEDAEIARQLTSNGLTSTFDIKDLGDRNTFIICVPTPIDKGNHPNLRPLKNAILTIKPLLKEGSIIIIESTINPGVCDEVVVPLVQEDSKLECGKDINLIHCPERINPGDKVWDVSNIPRVVGGIDESSLNIGYALYSKIIDADIKKMGSLKEAEAVKILENSFRDVNIAFVNEIAMSFRLMDIDVFNVIEGASTKPFSFMAHYPGIGVGGHCIPVDPYYLIEQAKNFNFSHNLLVESRSINNSMPEYALSLIQDKLNSLGRPIKGERVAILGIAYKPNIGDVRESPVLDLVNLLNNKGAIIKVHDPFVSEKIDNFNNDALFKDIEDINNIIKWSDTVVMATPHKCYLELDSNKLLDKVIFDPNRSMLDVPDRSLYFSV